MPNIEYTAKEYQKELDTEKFIVSFNSQNHNDVKSDRSERGNRK